MKKGGLLNSDIAALISNLGHQDFICVSDAGLAIPDEVRKIDISLKDNVPGLMDVLNTLQENLFVEKIILTKQMKENSPEMFTNVTNLFAGVEVELIDHADFKNMLSQSKGVIRTGEFTAYSNVLLIAGADPERWR